MTDEEYLIKIYADNLYDLSRKEDCNRLKDENKNSICGNANSQKFIGKYRSVVFGKLSRQIYEQIGQVRRGNSRTVRGNYKSERNQGNVHICRTTVDYRTFTIYADIKTLEHRY